MQFEYAVSVEPNGHALSEHGAPARRDLTWSPEHLVLESLIRCSMQSLSFHADRAGVTVAASGDARGVVERPKGETRMRLAEVSCELEVVLDPLPETEVVEQLLADAEHDCFVGATLKPEIRYRWHVNGELREPAGLPTGMRQPEPAPVVTDPIDALPSIAGLSCDRCGQAAPSGDLSEWHAWNPAGLGEETLGDAVGVHVLICPACRAEEHSHDELRGGE